jgi:DHA2 family multidrug resistance protein-like MFS transporter
MELGGALGIAVLGSVLTAGYRGDLRLPVGLPSAAADAAHESLAGAVGAAASLPGGLARGMVAQAQQAYLSGLHLTVLAGAVLLLAGVPVVARLLRGVPAVIEEPDAEPALTAA